MQRSCPFVTTHPPSSPTRNLLGITARPFSSSEWLYSPRNTLSRLHNAAIIIYHEDPLWPITHHMSTLSSPNGPSRARYPAGHETIHRLDRRRTDGSRVLPRAPPVRPPRHPRPPLHRYRRSRSAAPRTGAHARHRRRGRPTAGSRWPSDRVEAQHRPHPERAPPPRLAPPRDRVANRRRRLVREEACPRAEGHHPHTGRRPPCRPPRRFPHVDRHPGCADPG